jgi:arylsulfatase A-like enzyme
VFTVMKRPDRSPAASRVITAYALDARFETLAERLRARGFATFGIVHTSHIGPEYGFAQGFDSYGDPGTDAARIDRFVVQAAGAARPFFGYLHVLACHHPFPAEERDAAYMTTYALPYDEAGRRAVGVDFTTADVMWPIRDGSLRLDAQDVRFLNLVYEASLRDADEHSFAVLIAALRRAGAYDDSLIIVSADHGEELYDHGGYAHGHALWEEVIHVPLVIKFPRGTKPGALGHEVTALTSNVDLVPTLLAALGVPVPPELPGRSLVDPVEAHPLLAETVGADGVTPLWALLSGDHKLLASGATRQLFDLVRDPGEHDDLAARQPEVVATLERAAAGLRGADAPAAPTVRLELPADVLEKLRKLGYASPDG